MKESTMANGRVCVYVPNHPKANNRGYVLRSRHRMEQKLGRFLREGEEVHHKNEIKTDDRPCNLEVKFCSEHGKLHHPSGFSIDGKSRRLNYNKIQALVNRGLGYRRIARILKEPVYSVKYACKVLNKKHK